MGSQVGHFFISNGYLYRFHVLNFMNAKLMLFNQLSCVCDVQVTFMLNEVDKGVILL